MKIYVCRINNFSECHGKELVIEKRRISRLLLRKLCNVTSDDMLCYSEHGKPYLKDNSQYFNISNSGEYVILAVCNSEVGVDIELIKPYSQRVVKRCFTAGETATINCDCDFFKIWTAKESIMKLMGLGFALPPISVDTLNCDYYLCHKMYNDYVICVALSQQEDVELIEVEEKELTV